MKPQKTATLLDYGRRIERVVAHIAANLDEPLDLGGLAAIACFSPYHFHRIYRGMTGETAADTLRRLRLHRASGELVRGTAEIAGIARRAGYGSVEAFNRAFAQSYGLPPAAYRRKGRLEGMLEPPVTVNSDTLSETVETTMQDVTIGDLPALTLIGIDHAGPYMEIGGAFDRLIVWAASRNLIGPDTRSFGVYFDDPEAVAPEKLRSFAGMTCVNPVTLDGPVRAQELPAGRYAQLVHKGPYAELERSYRRLYGEWLPQSGHTPADSPCYEEYLNDPRNTPPEELLTRICVPLA